MLQRRVRDQVGLVQQIATTLQGQYVVQQLVTVMLQKHVVGQVQAVLKMFFNLQPTHAELQQETVM
jgi:hypothetical protein